MIRVSAGNAQAFPQVANPQLSALDLESLIVSWCVDVILLQWKGKDSPSPPDGIPLTATGPNNSIALS